MAELGLGLGGLLGGNSDDVSKKVISIAIILILYTVYEISI